MLQASLPKGCSAGLEVEGPNHGCLASARRRDLPAGFGARWVAPKAFPNLEVVKGPAVGRDRQLPLESCPMSLQTGDVGRLGEQGKGERLNTNQ
mgnify:CR=1 FL=1